MRIQDLEYHAPTSLAEASVLLHTFGGDAKLLAGGTDVLADLKQGLLTSKNLVSLAKIKELKKIETTDAGLWIGALVTPNQLVDSKEVQRVIPGLSDAAASMAGMQIRNLATLGGNLCSAVPSADLPPSLLTMEAELLLVSQDKERKLPLRSFFTGPRRTAISHEEILASVIIPAPPQGTGTAYKKFQLRGASALAVVGAAARVTVKDNAIQKALIAIGAAAPTPLVIDEAGEFLSGKQPTEENFIKAGEIAAKSIQPISDLRGSEEYRRQLAKALSVRALKSALDRI